jgi:hypothetical protein
MTDAEVRRPVGVERRPELAAAKWIMACLSTGKNTMCLMLL